MSYEMSHKAIIVLTGFSLVVKVVIYSVRIDVFGTSVGLAHRSTSVEIVPALVFER